MDDRRTPRTRPLVLALAAAGTTLCAAAASAQGWPEKPVRLIVPFAPGGAADRVARVIAERLGATFGQPFLADNRPGAAGAVGYELLARAAPDGLTLGTASDSSTLLPLSQKGLRWSPLDFTAISLVTTQPLVLAVHASVAARTVAEFAALAKAKPGAIAFGSSGHGHPQHLTGELIARAAGFGMTHVPYKGGGAAITDLVGGQIQAAVLGSSPVIPFHRAGKVRILAVTSSKRSPAVPEVPTLAEAGVPGIDVVQWIGVVGPPKLGRERVVQLNAAIVKALEMPSTREALESAGFDVQSSTPEQFAARFRETLRRWERLVGELKLRFEP